MDYSPPSSSIHRILQAGILEWVVISFSRGSSRPRDWTQVPCSAGRFFTNWATMEDQEKKGHGESGTMRNLWKTESRWIWTKDERTVWDRCERIVPWGESSAESVWVLGLEWVQETLGGWVIGGLEREQPGVLSSCVARGEAICSQAKVACGVFEPERWAQCSGGWQCWEEHFKKYPSQLLVKKLVKN